MGTNMNEEEDIRNIMIEIKKEIIYKKQNNGDVTPIWIKDISDDDRELVEKAIQIIINL